MSESAPWWRNGVIYQVYVRSFADSDGDGIGDLSGIRSRLGYLRDLGVDALWVTPFYPSPMADGGYDVADYRDVEPLFGTLADADQLIKEAGELGIRVIVDLVPNHTSDQHAWFQAALAAGPGSPERDRYIFRPGGGPDGSRPPNNWKSGFGGAAWRRVPDGEWYLHLFTPEQPDLDWTHPEVWAEFRSILRFWLDRGVAGFRIDVAHGLVKDPGLPDVGWDSQELHDLPPGHRHPFWDREGVHEVYRDWRKVLDSYDGDRIAVAEAWVPDVSRMADYVRADELHQTFNFEFLQADWVAAELRQVIDESLAATARVGATTTWVLSNHDVTRHVTRYGGGAQGLRRARAATLLMLALPGAAYLYQGEELGLPEVEDLPEEVLADPIWTGSGHTERGRDGCRVPIPWSAGGSSYGFGPDGSTAWLPQPESWAELSVESQTGVEGSTLELYRRALLARRCDPALRSSTPMRWRDLGVDVIGVSRDPGFLCVVNFATAPTTLPAYDELLVASAPVADRQLPGESAAWLRVADRGSAGSSGS